MDKIFEAMQSSGLFSVLGGVFAWIFCHVIYAVITAKTQHKYDKELEEEKALIQHDCDIRLERYRLEFNQLLSERQTRFQYWYDEKAKAIKELYEDACKLYFSLLSLHVFNRMHKDKDLDDPQKKEWNEMRNTISNLKLNVANNWYRHRLFLNDEEDDAFNEFGKETNEWSKMLDERYDQKEVLDKGERYNDSIKDLLGNLRTIFRKAFYAATSDTSLNGINISHEIRPQQTPPNDSPRSES